MDFDNQYLEYDEYQELGGSLTQMPFNLFEFKSRKKIDELTSNKISSLLEIPQEVKLCVFDLIDVYSQEDNSNIASESIGDYSKTNKTASESEDTKITIIKNYLSNTKVNDIYVLYCGADI